jgi:amidase
MARTVRDAAILLGAMTGSDPEDALSSAYGDTPVDFTGNLAADALEGKRIGVIRSYYGAGENPGIEALLADSIDALKAAGAVVVDNVILDTEGMGDAEGTVLYTEFKADLASYFGRSGARYRTLTEIIAFNDANAARVMPIFGQERMLQAEESGALTDQAYVDALTASKDISQTAIDNALAEHNLHALIAPTNGPDGAGGAQRARRRARAAARAGDGLHRQAVARDGLRGAQGGGHRRDPEGMDRARHEVRALVASEVKAPVSDGK